MQSYVSTMELHHIEVRKLECVILPAAAIWLLWTLYQESWSGAVFPYRNFFEIQKNITFSHSSWVHRTMHRAGPTSSASLGTHPRTLVVTSPKARPIWVPAQPSKPTRRSAPRPRRLPCRPRPSRRGRLPLPRTIHRLCATATDIARLLYHLPICLCIISALVSCPSITCLRLWPLCFSP